MEREFFQLKKTKDHREEELETQREEDELCRQRSEERKKKRRMRREMQFNHKW